MIPLLISTFYKELRTHRCLKNYVQFKKFLTTAFYIVFVSVPIIFLSLIPKVSKTQHLRLNYKILKGEDEIGWLQLEKNTNGSKSTLLLTSEIKMRVLFLITVVAKESATFENGKLVCSSQFRKTNGTTKLDKQTRLFANAYEVLENGERKSLAIQAIVTNLTSLYFQEPIGISNVYCDIHECFVQVIKTTDGGYQVKFPDGNSNSFYYTAGTCTRVKVSHRFYSAEIMLN